MSKLARVLEEHVKDPKERKAVLAEMETKINCADNVKFVCCTEEEAGIKLAPQAVCLYPGAVDTGVCCC